MWPLLRKTSRDGLFMDKSDGGDMGLHHTDSGTEMDANREKTWWPTRLDGDRLSQRRATIQQGEEDK